MSALSTERFRLRVTLLRLLTVLLLGKGMHWSTSLAALAAALAGGATSLPALTALGVAAPCDAAQHPTSDSAAVTADSGDGLLAGAAGAAGGSSWTAG